MNNSNLTPENERLIGAGTHLITFFVPFLGPILVYVLVQNKFVRDHAKQALNVQISLLLYALVPLIITFISGLIGFGTVSSSVFDNSDVFSNSDFGEMPDFDNFPTIEDFETRSQEQTRQFGFLFVLLSIAGAAAGLLWLILGLAYLIYPLIGAVKAGNGQTYRFPFVIRFLR